MVLEREAFENRDEPILGFFLAFLNIKIFLQVLN